MIFSCFVNFSSHNFFKNKHIFDNGIQFQSLDQQHFNFALKKYEISADKIAL